MTLFELRSLFRFSFPIFREGDRVVPQSLLCYPLTDHFKEQYIETAIDDTVLDPYMIHRIHGNRNTSTMLVQISPFKSRRNQHRITLNDLLSVCDHSLESMLRIYYYRPNLTNKNQEDFMNVECYKRYTLSDFQRTVSRQGNKREYEIIKMREIVNKLGNLKLEVVVV